MIKSSSAFRVSYRNPLLIFGSSVGAVVHSAPRDRAGFHSPSDRPQATPADSIKDSMTSTLPTTGSPEMSILTSPAIGRSLEFGRAVFLMNLIVSAFCLGWGANRREARECSILMEPNFRMQSFLMSDFRLAVLRTIYRCRTQLVDATAWPGCGTMRR